MSQGTVRVLRKVRSMTSGCLAWRRSITREGQRLTMCCAKASKSPCSAERSTWPAAARTASALPVEQIRRAHGASPRLADRTAAGARRARNLGRRRTAMYFSPMS